MPCFRWIRFAILLLMCLSLLGEERVSAVSLDQTWDDLHKRGCEALDTNKYWLAEPLLRRAVAESEKFGFDDLRFATSLNSLARLYTIRSRFSEAEPLLEKELAVREMSFGKTDTKMVPAMGTLIKFYLTYGTAAKADSLTEDMLAVVEGKMREPQVAQISGKKIIKDGGLLEGWAGTAAPVAQAPLMDWAVTCDAVGNLYLSRGQIAMAERLFKAAVDVKATILGKGHLSLAHSYDSLGSVYTNKKDDAEAETYLRDSLAASQTILEENNAELFNRIDRLARHLIKSGKRPEAEALYQQALASYKKAPGKHPQEARALYALGSSYADAKNYAAAAPLLARAIVLQEHFNGPCHIGLVPFLEKYAYSLYYLGRRTESEQLKARARNIAGDSYPGKSAPTPVEKKPAAIRQKQGNKRGTKDGLKRVNRQSGKRSGQ